eukprot:1196067-Prorocentrum_minimum.AAC.17
MGVLECSPGTRVGWAATQWAAAAAAIYRASAASPNAPSATLPFTPERTIIASHEITRGIATCRQRCEGQPF